MEKSKKTIKNRLSDYVQKCLGLALKAAIWAGVCLALNIALLYFCQLMLGFYLKAPMGPEFVASNPELMDTISRLTEVGFEQLSITLTLTAFLTCLGIMAACKFFFLARYITPMGPIGRIIACALPISAVVAMMLPESVPDGGWSVAYGLSVFPTIVIFNICFTISDELLPELDDVMAFFQKKDNSGKSFNARR
jgi:hypothetical protein